MLEKLFCENKKNKKFLAEIRNQESFKVSGLTGSRLSFFTGNIFSELSYNNIVLITSSQKKADTHYEDLIRLLDEDLIYNFAEMEVLPHEQIIPDYHVRQSRLQVLQESIFGDYKKIIIIPVTALMRRMMPPEIFREYSVLLKKGQKIRLEKFKEDLSLLGYNSEDMIENSGEFSVRGGIIDVYPPAASHPLRLELFGDEIDSLRRFEISSQRSTEEIEQAVIPPADEIVLFPHQVNDKIGQIKADYDQTIEKLRKLDQKQEAEYLSEKKEEVIEKLKEFNSFPGYRQFLPYLYEEPATLFDYFGQNSILFFEHYSRLEERIKSYSRDMQETTTTLLEQGSILPTYSDNFLFYDEFKRLISSSAPIFFSEEFYQLPFEQQLDKEIIYDTTGVEPYHSQLELFADKVDELTAQGYRVIITLNSAGKVERIREFLADRNLSLVDKPKKLEPGCIYLMSNSLAEGFIMEDFKLAVFTEQEVIGNPQKTRKKLTGMDEGVKISSLNELDTGDYVVHENHGIGKYLGVKSLEVKGQHQDYLVLKYANDDKLYVPTDKVDLVQKYVGADGNPPSLYELGGSKWEKVKQKVQNSVKEMAVELLDLYAERETVDGFSFSADSELQNKFEAAFPYEETPDQLQAIEEVKQDMESSTPMDRLLCGDVGYGKTEVALRAAFKAAVDGKQTAVLVPTTILAQQHYNTFLERMEGFPVMVEMISRFRTRSEQKKILEKVAQGKVDIIIGTHRLLSGDVVFNDLGLLVIDEEQRFGVSHKEKIKDLKRNLDVLTLSATPIPRTLHMALAGVRDMSVIETPPENRYPIRTYIREYNDELIKEALRREMGREGQIYFVHNRVHDIDKQAEKIRKLVPEASIAVAHGQMSENRLEKIMYDFYNQEYDVLVCTTIIETGLDIPNVNTIIINRAEQMGLAQLYQLRGRVGRTDRIAYAYLVYKQDKVLSEVAEKRLKAIKEFTNLGSGFKIAMRDLEIRGAGNLLGPEQHGHIASIGFSLYCKLLENAVEELKGDKEEETEVEVDLEIDAYLPEEYIPDSRQKIEIYKKIKQAQSESQLKEVRTEIKDRFGQIPVVVDNLIDSARLRIKAIDLGIEKIVEKEDVINIHFQSMEPISGTRIHELIDNYPRQIKIRSGNKPVIGVKHKQEGFPVLVEQVLNDLSNMIFQETG